MKTTFALSGVMTNKPVRSYKFYLLWRIRRSSKRSRKSRILDFLALFAFFAIFLCKNVVSNPSYMPMKIRSHPGADADFATAYDEYADAIFRHCCYRCFNRERAKELMQDTFMKAWDYLVAGNDIDNVQAFLYRTANNLLIDEARRAKKRKVVSFEDMAEGGFDVEGEDGRDQARIFDAKAVAEVLHELEEPYRTAIIMRYIDELSPKEIAELLNETANVVSVRLNRGMKMLRTILTQYE